MPHQSTPPPPPPSPEHSGRPHVIHMSQIGCRQCHGAYTMRHRRIRGWARSIFKTHAMECSVIGLTPIIKYCVHVYNIYDSVWCHGAYIIVRQMTHRRICVLVFGVMGLTSLICK